MTARALAVLAGIVLVLSLAVTEPPLWVLGIAAVMAWATLALTIRAQTRPRYRRGRGDR